jgi:hypothetical protein
MKIQTNKQTKKYKILTNYCTVLYNTIQFRIFFILFKSYIQHSTFNIQHATFNIQHATFNNLLFLLLITVWLIGPVLFLQYVYMCVCVCVCVPLPLPLYYYHYFITNTNTVQYSVRHQ